MSSLSPPSSLFHFSLLSHPFTATSSLTSPPIDLFLPFLSSFFSSLYFIVTSFLAPLSLEIFPFSPPSSPLKSLLHNHLLSHPTSSLTPPPIDIFLSFSLKSASCCSFKFSSSFDRWICKLNEERQSSFSLRFGGESFNITCLSKCQSHNSNWPLFYPGSST